MPATYLLLLVLLPQLVDRTDQANQQLPPSAELSPERRGDIYMARKMFREAVEGYNSAVALAPRDARLFNKLGIAYHHQMMLDEARKNYERATKIDKGFAQAVNNLGTIYYAKRRYKKAAQTYRKALELSPNSASIHSNLGTALFARKKFKEATEAYLTALQLDPFVFEHRNSMGTLLQERAVEDRARYHYFLAKAYAAAGIHERALFYLRRSLEEGFKRRPDSIASEKEFAALREDPQFLSIVYPAEAAELRPPAIAAQ
jgi:tetratricopeptide (TPR) repeat protein